MESAVIHSSRWLDSKLTASVTGSSMCFRTPKFVQWPLKNITPCGVVVEAVLGSDGSGEAWNLGQEVRKTDPKLLTMVSSFCDFRCKTPDLTHLRQQVRKRWDIAERYDKDNERDNFRKSREKVVPLIWCKLCQGLSPLDPAPGALPDPRHSGLRPIDNLNNAIQCASAQPRLVENLSMI
ncbi:hypothetical protein Tco_0445719 [Tanacetum coccineum]